MIITIITTITPRDTGVALNDLSWARFSAPRQQILLLPLEENIGLYNFRVQVSDDDPAQVSILTHMTQPLNDILNDPTQATDSGGESQQDTLVISVRQQTISRTFHHQFKVALKASFMRGENTSRIRLESSNS